ncbi:MAG: transketolase [Candidatus Omnitrophota bacterium]
MSEEVDLCMLEKKAVEIRKEILTMLSEAGSGHPGGSLSLVEILLWLYYGAARVDPMSPDEKNRDWVILSKGHGCPALYAVLADKGFFPKEELRTLRKLGSRLQGHPQKGLPGLEVSSGSLGQGLSISVGIAIGNRMDGIDSRVYCIMGDGETNEGQVWEAAMTAAHYKLENICAIIDYNKLQIDGFTCEVKEPGEIKKKWEAFGWCAHEADGHDLGGLKKVFEEAARVKGRPQIVIAHTIKGKGVSFMENKAEWHGVAPKKEQLEIALAELTEIGSRIK